MSLRETTNAYWHLSKAYNGRKMPQGSPTVTIGNAMDTCNNILDNTGSHRALAKKTNILLDDIIENGGKSVTKKGNTHGK